MSYQQMTASEEARPISPAPSFPDREVSSGSDASTFDESDESNWTFFKRFYRGLSPSERRHFMKVTEEMPLDPSAGLGNIQELVEPAKSLPTQFMHLFLYARIVLNMAFLWYQHNDLYIHPDHHEQVSTIKRSALMKWINPGTESGSEVEVHEDYLKICERSFATSLGAAENQTGDNDTTCFFSVDFHRMYAMEMVQWFELLAVTALALCVVGFSLRFLCCKSGKGTRLLPEKCPVFFFLVPNVASKFSLLVGLQFLSSARMKSFLLRREFKLVSVLCFKSVKGLWEWERQQPEESEEEECCEMKQCVFEPGVEHPRTITEASSKGVLGQIAIVLGLLFQVVLIGVAFQALLVKFTLLKFLAVRSWNSWFFEEWVLAAGFTNQMMGAVDVEWIELHRVLLMKFGGEDTKWQATECDICSTFFELLGRAIAKEEGNSFFGRWRALGVMSSLGSAELQNMLLSDKLEMEMESHTEPRLRFYRHLLLDDGCDEEPSEVLFQSAIEKVCNAFPEQGNEIRERLAVERRKLMKSVVVGDGISK